MFQPAPNGTACGPTAGAVHHPLWKHQARASSFIIRTQEATKSQQLHVPRFTQTRLLLITSWVVITFSGYRQSNCRRAWSSNDRAHVISLANHLILRGLTPFILRGSNCHIIAVLQYFSATTSFSIVSMQCVWEFLTLSNAHYFLAQDLSMFVRTRVDRFTFSQVFLFSAMQDFAFCGYWYRSENIPLNSLVRRTDGRKNYTWLTPSSQGNSSTSGTWLS